MTPEPSPHRHGSVRTYSTRRTLACFSVTLALVAVLVFDHTAATVHAAKPLGSFALNDGVPLTAAHRGNPVDAPENTMPAFESALEAGADILEFDLQLTADGHAVVLHDETVDRTTNGSGAVADLSLEQLRTLESGTASTVSDAATSIPTFEEVIALVQRSRTRALIEFKGEWPRADVRPVIAAIYRYGVQDRVMLASFDEPTVQALAQEAPSLARAVIIRRLPDDPVALAQRFGASAIVTSMRSFQVDPGAAQVLHDAGLTIVAYTLNRADLWEEARALDIDVIVTDAPRRLAQVHAALLD